MNSGIKNGDRVRVIVEGTYQRPVHGRAFLSTDHGDRPFFDEERFDVKVEKIVPQPPSTYRSVLRHRASGEIYVRAHEGWINALNGHTYGDGTYPEDWEDRYEVLHDAGKEGN